VAGDHGPLGRRQGVYPLAEQVGLEAWVEVMNHMFRVLGAEIYCYGGEIHQFRGRV
jgi:class 3 adenylate cyclase